MTRIYTTAAVACNGLAIADSCVCNTIKRFCCLVRFHIEPTEQYKDSTTDHEEGLLLAAGIALANIFMVIVQR